MPRLALLLLLAATASPAAGVPRGEIVDGIVTASDPEQTYAVYLPTSLAAGGRAPLLLVFDPRSRGAFAAGIFQDAAERYGWIVASSNGTRSDGPWEPNFRAVNAMWPDVMRRFPVDPRRIYAAGFSGGAMLAMIVGQETGRLAGVISVGGRLPEGLPTETIRFAHFGAAGRHDFNGSEMRAIERLLETKAVPHRLERFGGEHEWLDGELAGDAFAWFEILAMREGARERDERLVREILASELAAARRLEAAGRVLDAARRLRVIAATFEGLAEVESVAADAQTLASSRAARRQERDERRWERWEAGELRRLQRVLAAADGGDAPVPAARLIAELGIRGLKERARRGGEEGDAAARVLGSLLAQTSFYLPREMMERERWAAAALFLEVARAIRETWWVDYRLAAALARRGSRPQALEMLRRAVELGFDRADQLRTDENFAPLRDDPRFAELLDELERSGTDTLRP